MFKLERGTEQRLTLLECPHCGKEEKFADSEQPEEFDLVHVSPTGIVRVWLCRRCEKTFYTTFS
ncbi:MAG: hypothetical protein AB1393_14220 [Candidatus Edwardsbacteria bacterium]